MVFGIIQALTDMMFGESEMRYLRMEALEKLLDSHTQQVIKIEELKENLQRIPEGVKKREIEVALEEVLESKRDARRKLEMIIEELKGKLQEKRERAELENWEEEMEAEIQRLEVKFLLGVD